VKVATPVSVPSNHRRPVFPANPCAHVSAREAGYLLALYRLNREPGTPTQVALAKAVGVSAPTALEMVRRLRALALVEVQGLALTTEGVSAALALGARRHAAQVLSEEVLGLEAGSVIPEIDKLAPNLSATMVRRLNARRDGRSS
jgi:Mn-dependent DtxR family transcriptional regulator